VAITEMEGEALDLANRFLNKNFRYAAAKVLRRMRSRLIAANTGSVIQEMKTCTTCKHREGGVCSDVAGGEGETAEVSADFTCANHKYLTYEDVDDAMQFARDDAQKG
jgi:hypothetical protein